MVSTGTVGVAHMGLGAAGNYVRRSCLCGPGRRLPDVVISEV